MGALSLPLFAASCGSSITGDAFGAGDGSTDGAMSDVSAGDGGTGDPDAVADDGMVFTDGRGANFVPPFLGAVSRFAVVAGGSVTNTGVTTITGDLGVYPSPTPIGLTPPIVIGSTFLGTPEALAGENAMTTAYNQLAAEPCKTNLTGLELGGMTLPPGVYCFDSSAGLTGTLTLEDKADAVNHVWVFQVGTALTTATSSVVRATNGGSLCNVYWKIGSSATLGTGTTFGGSIIAMASITLNTNSTVVGRVLGRSGSVTMDTNTVSIASCPVAALDGGD
jgi:hypothetical protein